MIAIPRWEWILGAAVIPLCSSSHPAPAGLDPQVAPTAIAVEAIGQPGRLHHASLGSLPAPRCGIAAYPTRATDTAGLPQAGLQPCRLLRRPFHLFIYMIGAIGYIDVMPRKARIDAPGALHHIIIRGIERKAIFKDTADRENLFERCGQNISETQAGCYAWVYMRNHYLCRALHNIYTCF